MRPVKKRRLEHPCYRAWEAARSGDYRGASQLASKALAKCRIGIDAKREVELHLIRAFCAMRQRSHYDASRELDAAHQLASGADDTSLIRTEVWRAELGYFQGHYSDADELVDRVLDPLERNGDLVYLAFALRVRIAVHLARGNYEGVAALADRALRCAEASGDDYVVVQILNILGAFHFARATSKLSGPHARAHLTALDRSDIAPMEA